MRPISFESDRLYIRPSHLSDAPFVLEILNSPKWLMNIGDRNVHNLEDAEVYIQTKHLPQFNQHGFGNYILVNKETNETIGTCGLYLRPGLDVPDIGFAMLPQHENKGYGFESSIIIRDAAFNIFKLSKIAAITLPNNLESKKLLLKIGMVFQHELILPNGNEVLEYYELSNPNL